jgi:hypothetical protein
MFAGPMPQKTEKDKKRKPIMAGLQHSALLMWYILLGVFCVTPHNIGYQGKKGNPVICTISMFLVRPLLPLPPTKNRQVL